MSNLPEDERNWQNIQHFEEISNEALFQQQSDGYVYGNMPANTTAAGRYHQPMTESYSVFPVGHGNFLKVYHTNDNEQQQQSTFNSYELFSSNSLIPPHAVRFDNADNASSFPNNGNTTNMIINQLVTNWSPNLSGNYSPFGEQLQQQQQQQQQHQIQQQQQQLLHQYQQQQKLPLLSPSKTFTSPSVSDKVQEPPGIPTFVGTPLKTAENLSKITTPPTATSNTSMKTACKTNGSFENNQNLPEIKKRIVAEVKPMRMSYSDVLSKNVDVNAGNNAANNNQNNAINDLSVPIKVSKFSSEKKNLNGLNDRKIQNDDRDKNEFKSKKIDNSANLKSEEIIQNSNGMKKKLQNDDSKESIQQIKKPVKKPNPTEKNKMKNCTQNTQDTTKKRTNRRDSDIFTTKSKITINSNSTSTNNSNDKECFYNVAKTDSNYEKPQKSTQNVSTKKLSRHSSGQKNTNNSSMSRSERQSYSKRGHKQQKDIKYELISKFIEKWLEYSVKILSWLFYLIYDVIVLSFGIGFDRLKTFYHTTTAFLINLDFKQNFGRPNAWIKNLFKKFDNNFKKNSKWAFWRRFHKKKRNEESFTDFYKNGRLPQTGDEAMYSLLNCKEKDAYSILGVSPESSQEQIRKHYKKIAVLVHPDKNKQPGAEEAFKVLQRAFELIGEPENRKSYDQKLAEALNAEKAWSELHDLLSQLQTKIAEAAHTIRCSSCGLRHPRTLTDRHHYAARECSSCKIRHSAREGDIWAETSIFGLRWRYLALMEGKCYDITEWANCQKGALSHLQPNSHIVQYRIVRGGQQQQQQNVNLEKEKPKREQPSEPSLDEILDNLYSGQNPQQNASRRRSRRN